MSGGLVEGDAVIFRSDSATNAFALPSLMIRVQAVRTSSSHVHDYNDFNATCKKFRSPLIKYDPVPQIFIRRHSRWFG